MGAPTENAVTLRHLITQAAALAGGPHACVVLGHEWRMTGGRRCPNVEDGQCPCGENSQAVYECDRCGDVDYGHNPGPGWDDCVTLCGLNADRGARE